MKFRTCLLILLIAATAPAAAFDRKPGKKKKKSPRTETAQPHTAAPADTVSLLDLMADLPDTTDSPAPAEPEVNDLTLGLTAAQVDSLVAAWREQQRHTAFDDFFERYVLADTLQTDSPASAAATDSLYAGRLRDLASPVPLPYNAIVRGYINRYINPEYGTISRILGLSKYYFPMIEDELIRQELPVELRALPIIESALSPAATSRAGAAGLWQFMPSTGKVYGLEVNSLVDERRDPVRSTEAACRYLKDLYRIFNDWTLAIAAYNCGPGNVSKAIARSGGKTFWEIYDFLPRETRGYVPAFIGATYAYAYHRQHDLEPAETPIPLSVDTIRVAHLMHFEQIASTIDLPMETLRQLNPQYKLDIIPATTKPYTLVLPQRNIAQYIASEAEIRSKDSIYLKEYLNPANIDRKRAEQPASTYYKIRSGDTLGAIARRYHVTTQQLMRWNNIRDPRRLRIGQRIRVSAR